MKADSNVCMHRRIRVFIGRPCHFVNFVIKRLKYGNITSLGNEHIRFIYCTEMF